MMPVHNFFAGRPGHGTVEAVQIYNNIHMDTSHVYTVTTYSVHLF